MTGSIPAKSILFWCPITFDPMVFWTGCVRLQRCGTATSCLRHLLHTEEFERKRLETGIVNTAMGYGIEI